MIDDFNVLIKLIPDSRSRSKKHKERLWTVACNAVSIWVSRDEKVMPPRVIPKSDGTLDLTIRIPYFNKRGTDYKRIALQVLNNAIMFFKYELKQPQLKAIDEHTDEINNPKWIDDRGEEIRTGMYVVTSKGIFGQRNEYGVIKFENKHKRNLQSSILKTKMTKLHHEILSDAQSSAFEGNIRRAVLELAIACEVFIKHTLFGGSDISALAFEALEDKRIVSVRVLDMIDIGGVGVPNGSFKKYDKKAYQDIDYIFRARNKVAHRGNPVFRDEKGNLQKVDAKLLRQWWISVDKLFSWAS